MSKKGDEGKEKKLAREYYWTCVHRWGIDGHACVDLSISLGEDCEVMDGCGVLLRYVGVGV